MSDDPTSRCSLCGRVVLGLAGQDWSVLPWMTDAGAEVRPGPAHVRCLQERVLARLWAEAVEDYHCARWPLWLAGRDGGVRWRLHCSPQARRFHLWRADGRLLSFPYAAVRTDRLATELAEVGSDYSRRVLAAMGEGGEVPLARVITGLDLADRYPFAAGWVVRRERSVGTAARPEMIVVLEARHPLPLDAGSRRAAHALMHRPV